MKNSSIGYKFNFEDNNLEEVENFLKDYLKQFERYELKVTRQLISSEKIELLLNVSEKVAKGKYSLHILKDILNNSESYNMWVNLLRILNNIEITNEVYLVTHIPYGSGQKYFNKILDISKCLPKNYILLLENELIDSNNEEYLKQINNICQHLINNNIKNVGICLDFGHLLFGFSKENISQKIAISKIQEMFFVIHRIKELHIHDYLEKDHLKIKDGVMNLTLISEFIERNDLNVPIIIESSVELPDEGIKQVKSLKEFLVDSKNNDL